jgi:hypothetical protein
MITKIGAVLTVDEVKEIVEFIAKQYNQCGSLAETDDLIRSMQFDGMWEIYNKLRQVAREDREGE